MELVHRDSEMLTPQHEKVKKLISAAREAFALRDVSDEQMALAIIKCEKQGLDPFAGECYLVPYAGKVTVQISIHALLARAMRNPAMHHFGDAVILGKEKDGTLGRRQTCHVSGLAIMGAAVIAYWKDGRTEEYVMPLGMYKAASATDSRLPYMLGKAALANACRRACPTECAGLYITEEQELATAEPVHYDPSELHRDRYPELAQVGLTIESANRILGKYTDRASHEKALDELLDARHAEQQKDDKPADDKPAREREPGDDDVEMDDIDLGPETEMMQLDLTGGDDG